MNILTFLKTNGLFIDVVEREADLIEKGLPRFYVSIMGNFWIKKSNNSIITFFGNGATEELAIEDLSEQISGKTIIEHDDEYNEKTVITVPVLES